MPDDVCPEHVWRLAGVTLADDVLADYECQRCGSIAVQDGDGLRGIRPPGGECGERRAGGGR